MTSSTFIRIAFLTVISLTAIVTLANSEADEFWTEREVRILNSLFLDAAGLPPQVPSNQVADNPVAVELGRRIFFDTEFSADGAVSCSSCHQPDRYFTDGERLSKGIGTTLRNAPTIVGSGYGRWFYWDGRRDSLWSQALIPIEAADEMGGSRTEAVRHVGSNDTYRATYESVFGDFPDEVLDVRVPRKAGPYGNKEARDAWYRMSISLQRAVNTVYSNLGKSVEAFERTVLPDPTGFDLYVRILLNDGAKAALDSGLMSEEEMNGAKLFLNADKTHCLRCHNGPLFTNGDFHNIGTGKFSGQGMDYGRVFGLRAVLLDEFNCLGPYSDARPEQCSELRFLNKDHHIPLEGAFKVPTLRGTGLSAPFFHDGRFDKLSHVIQFYSSPPSIEEAGRHELMPIKLSEDEITQLLSFLALVGS